MSYPSINHWTCFARESAWRCGGSGGSKDTPVNFVANDIIPFDPMEIITIDDLNRRTEIKRNLRKLGPQYAHTVELEPADISLETYYASPFLLCTFFTHKAVVWTDPYTVAADFTDDDDTDTVGIVFARDAAGTGCEDNYGGIITSIDLNVREEDILRAIFGIKYFNQQSNSTDFATLLGSHAIADAEGWCDWNVPRWFSDCSATWGSEINTTNHNCEIKELSIKATREVSTARSQMEIIHSSAHVNAIDYEITLKVLATGDLSASGKLLDEAKKEYANKTKQSFVFSFGVSGTTETLTITNVFVDSVTDYGSGDKGEYFAPSFVLRGGEDSAMSYSGAFTVSFADPSSYITTS